MPRRLLRIMATGVLVGLAGLLTMATMIISECRNSALSCFATDSDMLGAAFAGAGITGMVFYALWGRDGPAGWWFAALGAVLVTGFGAMIAVLFLSITTGGSSVINDPTVLLLGPFLVSLMFAEYSVLALIWVIIMVAMHLILRQIFQKHTKE